MILPDASGRSITRAPDSTIWMSSESLTVSRVNSALFDLDRLDAHRTRLIGLVKRDEYLLEHSTFPSITGGSDPPTLRNDFIIEMRHEG